MQISTIKNPNFEKPCRNPSNRTQVNILKKKNFGYLSKKIWFRVCSVTAKMFELRNSGENRRKRSDIFFENLPREYKDFILVKKKFKIISCLCTFKIKRNKNSFLDRQKKFLFEIINDPLIFANNRFSKILFFNSVRDDFICQSWAKMSNFIPLRLSLSGIEFSLV